MLPSWSLPSLLALSLSLSLSACDASSCTEIACDHEATVTLPSGLVTGPYDLVLTLSTGPMLSARCADPSAPETADNPEGISCDLAQFRLVGEPAGARSLTATIVDVASQAVVVDAVEVRLDAVGEEQPNGPDCPPTCFVRNGQLVVSGPR